MKFTKTAANVISSLIVTWVTMLSLGYIPDGKWSHGITVVSTAIQIFMVNMGFNRTPSGTVIPDVAKKFIDNNAQVELKVEQPPK